MSEETIPALRRAKVGKAEVDGERPDWPLWKRYGFRFLLIYFLLYSHPFPVNYLPTPARIESAVEVVFDLEIDASWVATTAVVDKWIGEYSRAYSKAERWTVDRVAMSVFGLDRQPDRPLGSGDPTYSYVLLAIHLALAVLVAAIWSALDRRRRGHPKLFAWLLIGARFLLGFTMLSYGLSKVIPTQFPPFLLLERLLAPYGDSSPMNILWSFMSSSEGYTIFGGAGEVVGGLLLFWRRTATLGALVTAGVMTNVAAMNYCYDVPVKLYSTHLTLLALVILLPDVRRLIDILVLNRATERRSLRYPHFPITGTILKLLVLAMVVAPGIHSRLQRYAASEEVPELYGIWDVERFVVDGTESPPLLTDVGRWKHLVIDRWSRNAIVRMDGTRARYQLQHDSEARTLALSTSSDWSFEVDGDRCVMRGQFNRTFVPNSMRPPGDDNPLEHRDPQVEVVMRRVSDATEPADTEPVDPEPEPEPDSGADDEAEAARLAAEAKAEAVRLRKEAGLGGVWEVESFEIIDDVYLPRRQPAPMRWTELELTSDGTARVVLPTGRSDTFAWSVNGDGAMVSIRSEGQFDVSRPEPERLELRGTWRGHEIEVDLNERDLEEFLVIRRGYHWINEIPLNRY